MLVCCRSYREYGPQTENIITLLYSLYIREQATWHGGRYVSETTATTGIAHVHNQSQICAALLVGLIFGAANLDTNEVRIYDLCRDD